MHGVLSVAAAPLLALGTEYYLFGAAGLVSIAAFAGLILAPALGAYGRPWEKMAAAFLSLFVILAMVSRSVSSSSSTGTRSPISSKRLPGRPTQERRAKPVATYAGRPPATATL